MNAPYFHEQADLTLGVLSDALEIADAAGQLDVEFAAGILTVTLADKKQWVVSKHAPSMQLWLSSPHSGGLHFSYDEHHKKWKLADGRELGALLSQELQNHGIEVHF